MENYNIKSSFAGDLSSEQALHVYVKLLKTVPENKRVELEEAYEAARDAAWKRECEEVKKGMMF